MKNWPPKPPILNGNPKDESILTPEKYIQFIKKLKGWKKIDFPQYCIISFFKQHYRALEKIYGKSKIEKFQYHELYHFSLFKHKRKKIALVFPMMGSIAAALLDEIIALGSKKIIFIGGVGVLRADIARGDVIVPSRAIRDEGVSYHYLRPSKFAYPDKEITASIESVLKKMRLPYHRGTVWTTAAPFRETKTKVKKFHREGVVAVDMEAASFFAVAGYRKVKIGAIFSGGDYVGESEWDLRIEKKDLKVIKAAQDDLLKLAIKAVENL